MVDILAYVGGVFAMISFVPQIIKSLQSRSTSDISWMMLCITLISITSYEGYAWALGLTLVIITNAVLFISVLVLIYIKYRFDRLNRAQA